MLLVTRAVTDNTVTNEISAITSELYLSQYFQFATVTVLVYDAIITMDKEVTYFWKVPRKTVNFVYFINRYFGIFGTIVKLYMGSFNLSLRECTFSIWSLNISTWVIVILMDYTLMIRVLALYYQSLSLSICLKTLLAMEAAFKLGLVIYLISLEHFVIVELTKETTLCGADVIPSWHWVMVDWAIPLVYGSVLMILALRKASEYWRMSAGFRGFTLVKVLIQDQVIYFILVISCSIFSIINFRLEVSNPFLASTLSALGNPSFLSLLGSRMLLNLKDVGRRGQNEGTSYNMTSRAISEIDFVDPGTHQR